MFDAYNDKLKLLVQVLPYVAEERCFGLHGGTAINLFVRDLPRLSVDIDLTYLPLEDRPTSLSNISLALDRIKRRIEARIPNSRVIHKEAIGKLLIYQNRTEIKLEVNLVGRGAISEPTEMPISKMVQERYAAFVSMLVVPFGQLYGGKICAALDRQHPRDLFDVKLLMEAEGFSNEVRRGFLFCLLGGDRPIHEILFPNLQDQRQTMENQFTGMSDLPFTYEEFEQTREQLIQTVKNCLTQSDKSFLLSIKNGEPDWSLYDFEHFPAVQWKLQNIRQLKQDNPAKHMAQLEALKKKLGT